MLSAVLHAQRELTGPHTEALADELGLDPDARRYFIDLVAAEQAETRARRHEALERVFAARRFRAARRVADDAWDLFSSPHLSAIAELVACPGFREDPAWIGASLRPVVAPEVAQDGVELLLRLGVLVRLDGKLQRGADTWATDHEASRAASLGLHRLHRDTLVLAVSALDLPRDMRHFATFSAAVDAATLARVKERLARCMEELMQLCTESGPPDRVIQVAAQLFPTSSVVGSEPAQSMTT